MNKLRVVMRRFSAYFLSIVLLACVNVASGAGPAVESVVEPIVEGSGWKKVKDTDGIVVYTQRDINGGHFRAVGRVQVNDLHAMVALLEDYDAISSWIVMLTELKELARTDEYNRYMYGVSQLPIISSRDLVFNIGVSQDPVTRSITVNVINAYDYIPLNPEYIRLTALNGVMKFDVVSDTEMEVTFEFFIHAGGMMAASIGDYFLKFGPYLAIKKIREEVKNPKYHNRGDELSYIKF